MKTRKKWLGLTLGVAFLAIVTACNFVMSKQTQEPQALSFPTEDPYLEIERVPLAEAKAAFDNGTAIFVDVRSSSAYADAHIPGALSIPNTELESRLSELDPKQWIITYCT